MPGSILDAPSISQVQADLRYAAKVAGKGLSTNDYTDADRIKLTSLSPVNSNSPVITPSATYAYTTYTTAVQKEHKSYYFGKSTKVLNSVGVFIFRSSASGAITSNGRLQVLHKTAGGVTTILLDKTLTAAELNVYTTTTSVSNYRNNEYIATLTNPVTLNAGDFLFVSLYCADGLNPIYCTTNQLLSTGEWNDGTTPYFRWSAPGTAPTYSTFPTDAQVQANPSAIHFYTTIDLSGRVTTLESQVTALAPGSAAYELLSPSYVLFPNNAENGGFTARKEAVKVYLQRFFRNQMPLFLNQANEYLFGKNAANTATVETETRTLTFSGTGYATQTVNVDLVSVNTSILKTQTPLVMNLTDSIGTQRRKNGVEVGAGSMWAMAKEIALKNKQDAGTGYDYYCLGGPGNTAGVNTNITYAGQTLNVKGTGTIFAGWAAFNFLRHPFKVHSNQAGAWALLGLLTTQGRAYAGTSADMQLIANTIWGVATPVITKDSYDLLVAESQISSLGAWSGSSPQIAACQAYIDSVAAGTGGENPFFNIAKSGTNRMDIAAYFARYKTLASDGVTRLVVGSTAGTRVTSATAYDVCTPTHLVITLGENDRFWNPNYVNCANDVLLIASLFQTAISGLKVGLALTGIPGLMLPDRFPNHQLYFSLSNHQAKYDFYKELMSRFSTLAAQKTANLYLIPTWHCMTPACNLVTNEITDEGAGRTTFVGAIDAIHPGYYSLREGGIQVYAWVAYTYS